VYLDNRAASTVLTLASKQNDVLAARHADIYRQFRMERYHAEQRAAAGKK
jgi:hypothetical protein